MSKKSILLLALAGILLLSIAAGSLYAVDVLSDPKRPADRFVEAVKSGNDEAAYAALSNEVRTCLCDDSPGGAASKIAKSVPELGNYVVQVKSEQALWLADSGDDRNRLELSQLDGGWPIPEWRVDIVRSTSQETLEEKIKARTEWTKTKHLPKGVKVRLTKAVNGKREVTYDVMNENGEEMERAIASSVVVKEARNGTGWQGTGSKAPKAKSVSHFKVGTKYNKRDCVVTNPSTKLRVKDGMIVVSWRINNPSGGTTRAVLLGDSTVSDVGGRMKPGGSSTLWTQAYSSWPEVLLDLKGNWIAVVELNDKPAIWKEFVVK